MSDTLPPLPEPAQIVIVSEAPMFTADQMRSYAAAALAAAVDDKPRAWIDRWGNLALHTLRDTTGATPLYTRPAAVAEPVALETVYETIIHWDEGGGKRSRRELARRIVALYAAPLQREAAAAAEPLTDEQARTHCTMWPGSTDAARKAWLIGFRAAERAHGITASAPKEQA